MGVSISYHVVASEDIFIVVTPAVILICAVIVGIPVTGYFVSQFQYIELDADMSTSVRSYVTVPTIDESCPYFAD